MAETPYGTLLTGDEPLVREAYERFASQPVDWNLTDGPYPGPPRNQRTIRKPVSIAGPGTFFGKAVRRLTFEPFDGEGWWFDRTDLPDSLPTRVSVRNVWTTGAVVSNIVLRSGAPSNYVRMVEHMVALRIGLGIDNLMIRIDSGDPPLFNRGSLDLVEALEKSGFQDADAPAKYVTVKETVTLATPHGGFLTFRPLRSKHPELHIDCAIDFPDAIGQQRVRFPVTYDIFRQAAEARTNTSYAKKLYCQTLGKIFADVRHLGYTNENILVAGRKRYVNEPRLLHEGKSLEAVWHRAALDLLAAVSLIEEGRFVGEVVSYKAGHGLDVKMVTYLYLHGLLAEWNDGMME
ncbi:MAG: UDP-3-O-acyl-N-acetylglucosamine deacetylase [Phycisphaerae bacterium]|nr:UDP-3-O-acyl-N-acetylglucosamine deacetylase [Phycisphaerae bacterium]